MCVQERMSQRLTTYAQSNSAEHSLARCYSHGATGKMIRSVMCGLRTHITDADPQNIFDPRTDSRSIAHENC